jgi:hypothetical protein
MRALYAHLKLGDFSIVQRAVEEYAARSKRYQTNEYELSEAARRQIARRWKPMIDQYGYSVSQAPPAPLHHERR